jgi:hypothetical protein
MRELNMWGTFKVRKEGWNDEGCWVVLGRQWEVAPVETDMLTRDHNPAAALDSWV